MPPDRTAKQPKASSSTSSNAGAGGDRPTSTSFTAAALMQLPLSSHGSKHAPSLERGKACLVCRSRKIKCDAIMPACTSCRKSASAKGEDPDLIRCDYDEPEKRRKPVGGGKVAGLEAKIASLERRIEELTSASPSSSSNQHEPGPPSSSAAGPTSTPIASTSALPDLSGPDPTPLPALPRLPTGFDTQLGVPTFDATPLPTAESTYSVTTEPLPREVGASIANHVYFVQSHSAHRPAPPIPPPLSLPSSSPLLELFYPGWPPTLPTPALVFRLVETFFARAHLFSVMINRGKLMASLQLPPTHSDFPITPLLHAIIAVASSLVSEDIWQGEERYWALNETPGDWHGRQARSSIEAAWVNDDNYVQVAQTAVLGCFLSYSAARFGEVWLETAQAVRLAIPLGLNHLRTLDRTDPASPIVRHIKSSMLTPTSDADTLFELSVTFWFAVACDKFAAASTGWAMSLDDNDITTLLPGPPNWTYPSENLNSSPLSIHNPHFLISHPPELVQSLQLYLKAVVLMGRVVSYLQRSPSAVGVGPNNGPPRKVNEPIEAYLDPRSSVAFKQLDRDIIGFQLSVPREYQHLALHASSDVRVSLIHAVPHASTILLHEPFCTMEDGDKSMERCITAARAILGAIVTLYSSSFDIGLLVPFINFTWAVAGRTLVRELAIKQAKGIQEGCEEIRYSVNVILAAMRAYKSPLGGSTSAALEALLEHPSTCLPVHQRSTANQFKHMGHGFARILNPADPNGAPFYAPARGIQSKSTGGTFASPPQQAANPDRAMTMDELSSRMTGADPTDLSSLGNGGDTLDYDTLMMLQSTDFGDGQRILEMGDAASMHGVSRSETRGPDERRGA